MVTEYHNGDIFAIPNPLFISDTFIFDTSGKYIKVNCNNRIEEFGTDIEERLHCISLETILRYKNCEKACKRYKRMLKMIDDEYFEYLKLRKL